MLITCAPRRSAVHMRPHLAAYVERLKRRPSFAAAYVAYFQQLPMLLTGGEPPLMKQRFEELAHLYDEYAQSL